MSVPTTPPPAKESGFVAMARDLGRSRSGQILVAIVTLALFSGLAWLAWTNQETAGQIFAIGLIGVGNSRAWPLLPISVATRTRWIHEEKIVRGTWPGVLRYALPFGIYLFAREWHDMRRIALAGPGFFVILGIFAFWLCRRKVRAARKARAAD